MSLDTARRSGQYTNTGGTDTARDGGATATFRLPTVFHITCRYLNSLELRREIHQGLNGVEHWTSANDFIVFARRGEFSSNSREDQELSMLSLHLLQNCMVYINTLVVQQILA